MNIKLAALAALLTLSTSTNAAVIHESASLGVTGQTGGWAVNEVSWLASAFTITNATEITAVGGHMLGYSGELFGAIIEATSDGVYRLPASSPGEIETSAILSTTFAAPGNTSSDFRTPLSGTLAPGDYLLVFGGDAFDVVGSGGMANNGVNFPGQDYWYAGPNNLGSLSWRYSDPDSATMRFVVEGNVVPIPAAAWLFLSALGGLGIIKRRRR